MQATDFTARVLTIEGMHCDACVRRVSQALGNLPGVRLQRVEVGQAQVLAEPACDPSMHEAIEKAGFTVTGVRAES